MTGTLVAIDQPGGPGFVDRLQTIWEAGDAAFPVDQRLPDGSEGRAVHGDGGRPDRSSRAMRVVVATSGSTGTPKGVVLTHAAVEASAAATNRRLACHRRRPLARLPSAVPRRRPVRRDPQPPCRDPTDRSPRLRRRCGHDERRDARVARVDGTRPHRPDGVPDHRARREPAPGGPTGQHGHHVRHDRDRERRRLRRAGARRRRRAHRRRRRDPPPRPDAPAVLSGRHRSEGRATAGWRPAISASCSTTGGCTWPAAVAI